MCILVIKKPGAVMPSKSTLEACYQNNPDGAGFMFLRKDKQMEGHKGFFSFKKFWKALSRQDFGVDDTVYMHFRIATHGGINEGCCHPFPISTSDDDLKSTHFVVPNAMAHNGIIHGLPESKHISDTMMFVKCILSDPAILDNLDSSGVQYLVNNYVEGSRVAVSLAGKMYLFGKFEDVNGVLYSNSSYKPRTFSLPAKISSSYGSSYGSSSYKSLGDGYYLNDDWEYDYLKGTSYYSDDEDGSPSPDYFQLKDIKKDIFEFLLDNGDLREYIDVVSPYDLDILFMIEEAFLDGLYTMDEHRLWSFYCAIWNEHVKG